MADRLRSSAGGATGDARVASVDLTCRDAQLPASGRARLADDDVDIAAERGQQAEQALQGILAEVALSSRDTSGWVRPTTRAGLLTTTAAHASTIPLTSSRRRQAPFTEGVKSIGVHFISALGLSNELGPPHPRLQEAVGLTQ